MERAFYVNVCVHGGPRGGEGGGGGDLAGHCTPVLALKARSGSCQFQVYFVARHELEQMAITSSDCLQVMWAFCVYVEAVSVLPQLRMMQNAKVVEKFTSHYVFALGLSRFISCAHWILQIIDGESFLLQAIGSGLWPTMVLISELVQTFILADFWCVLHLCRFVV